MHLRTQDADAWQATIAQQLLLACYWFSLNVQTSSLLAIVVPVVLDRIVGAAHTVELARLATAVALLAMVVGPLAGAASDRHRARGGGRKALMWGGALANVVGLSWMAAAPGLPGLVGGLMLATLGQNASQAAYQALVPDVVPVEGRGTASGYMGAASLLGTISGLALAGLYGPSAAYAFMIATLVLGAAATAWAVPGAGNTAPASRGTAPAAAQPTPGGAPAGAPPSRHDYAVAFAGRSLIMLGLSLLMTFVLYFLQDVLHLANPGAGTAAVAGLALVGATVSSLYIGALSDRRGAKRGFGASPDPQPEPAAVPAPTGRPDLDRALPVAPLAVPARRRVPAPPGTPSGTPGPLPASRAVSGPVPAPAAARARIVAVSGVPMAITALAFACLPRPDLIFSFAVVFGLGYGAFLSVDWALAIDSLPEPSHVARDLGVWSIAGNLPSAAAPAIGGWLLSLFPSPAAGYRALFLLAGAAFAAGSGIVLRVGARPRPLPPPLRTLLSGPRARRVAAPPPPSRSAVRLRPRRAFHFPFPLRRRSRRPAHRDPSRGAW